MKMKFSALAPLCGLGLCAILLGQTAAADKDKTVKMPASKPLPTSKAGYGGWGANATGGAGKATVEVSTFDELSAALKKGNATILLKKDIFIPAKAAHDCIMTKAGNLTLDGQGHTIWGDAMPEGRGPGRGGSATAERGTRHIL